MRGPKASSGSRLWAIARWPASIVTIALALVVGTILGGLPMSHAATAAPVAGPPEADAALLVAICGCALVIAGLAARQAGTFKARFAVLFAVLFGLDSLLPLSEVILFEQAFKIPGQLIFMAAGVGMGKALAGACAATLLFGGGTERLGLARPLPARLAFGAALYVALYFAAGFSIAWQSEAVRSFYGNGVGIPEPSPAGLLPQFVRGLGFAGIAAALLDGLRGTRLAKALLAGSAFGLLVALPLLLPNGGMPWPVRSVHFLELAVSNVLFGFASAFILCKSERDGSSGSRACAPGSKGGRLRLTPGTLEITT